MRPTINEVKTIRFCWELGSLAMVAYLVSLELDVKGL